MRATRWVAVLMVSALGCSQTNAREGADASVDTREVPRDAMEVTHDSLCVGLDPASAECAREVLARMDRDQCEDQLACAPTIDPHFCDVYYPAEGAWLTDANQNQLVLVRLGRLRIDLDAAVCAISGNSSCGDTVGVLCGPVMVPTASFTTCTEHEECGRDGYCEDMADGLCGAGRCQPRPTSGVACAAGARCAWDGLCLDGLCRDYTRQRRTAALGAGCGLVVEGATYHHETCADGLACAFAGTSPATCVPIVSLGASCGNCPGPNCTVCGASLRCETNVCVPYALPREGDPCNGPMGRQGLCDNGTYGLLCENGLCVTNEGRIGDVCRIPCVEGYCAYTDDSSDVQRCLATRLPLGAFCGAIDQCENGLCGDGVCVPVPE